jgi:single-stranded-DNA-specific exonuclease
LLSGTDIEDPSLREGFAETTKQSLTRGVDLVALATLADIQELTDFNRSLVIEGLQQLTRTSRSGLQALYDVAGIIGKPVGVYEVGWVIGPRLNATGRLEHALDALRLLVVRNRDQAYELARKLNSLNFERQQITTQAVEQAIAVVDQTWNGDSPIVVASAEWHEGVIGLIAGRLVQQFNAPAIAISIGDDIAKGSARSIDGINVVELLRTSNELFENMGGHAAAAGFSIESSRVEELKSELDGISLQHYNTATRNEVFVDLELDPSFISYDLYKALSALEPHGVGNPRPTFYSKELRVIEKRVVGKGKDHLSLTFENNLRGIGFNLGEKLNDIGETAEVVYSIDKDDYRGNNSVQIKVKEIE